MTKSQSKASAKYDKANTKGLYIKLNLKTDSDIINHLKGKENIQGYLKSLIRSDIVYTDMIKE